MQLCEFSVLENNDKEHKEREIVQGFCERIKTSSQFYIADKCNGRRSKKNEECRNQLIRYGIVKNNPVKNDGKEHEPEEYPDAEKEPGHFLIIKLNARDWNNYKTNNRNKPCRIEMVNFNDKKITAFTRNILAISGKKFILIG
jgi:hypothetical protein